MPDTDKAAEKALQKLRRLPENRVCPNCLKEDVAGFSAICMQFKTFVCSDCKSAHQSFSHRTKSSSQSIWTMEEVKSLDERHGGGNKVAQERWLANVPDSERPIPDSSAPQVYKNFIERAYIEERWAGSGAVELASESGANKDTSSGKSSGSRRHGSHKKEKSESVNWETSSVRSGRRKDEGRKKSLRKREMGTPDLKHWQMEKNQPAEQLAEPWAAADCWSEVSRPVDQSPEAWASEYSGPMAYNATTPGSTYTNFNDGYISNGYNYNVTGALPEYGCHAEGWGPNEASLSAQLYQQGIPSPAPTSPQTARTAPSQVQMTTPPMSDRSAWNDGMYARNDRMAASAPMIGYADGADSHRSLSSFVKISKASLFPQAAASNGQHAVGGQTGPSLSVGNTTLRLKPSNPWASSIGGGKSARRDVRLAANNPWADAVAKAFSSNAGSSTRSNAGTRFDSNGTSCGASDGWAGQQHPQASSWVDAC